MILILSVFTLKQVEVDNIMFFLFDLEKAKKMQGYRIHNGEDKLLGLQRLLQLQVITALTKYVLFDHFFSRVNFRTDQLQIDWWWTNEDFIYLTFDEPVSFVTAAYPVKDAVLYSTGADGQQTYKLTFESHFNPGDKRIDFNIRKLNFAFSAINSSNSRIPRRQLDVCCVRCDNLSFLPPSSIFRGQRGSTSACSSS